MKKKKILLTGLLGVSILAAGITLASCNSIPLTPYEPSSSTAPVTPTPSSTSVVPTPSSVEPVTPSTSEVTPSPSASDPVEAFTISFETAHGTAPESIENATQITVAELPKMSVDYYSFKGWSIKDTTTIITEDTDLNADVTLVAQFEAMKTYDDFVALDTAGDLKVGVLDFTDYELGDGDTRQKQDVITEWETNPQAEGSKSNRSFTDILYQTRNATASSTTVPSKANNYVYAEDGKLKMYDKGDADKGASIIIFDTYSTKGVQEAFFDVSLSEAANSWTFLQVYGTDTANPTSNEIFGLRTVGSNSSDGKIKYRLDGGDPVDALADIAVAGETTYHIYLKADFATNTITVQINGKDFAEVEIDGLTSIDYIRFVSTNANARTVTIEKAAFYQDFATLEDAVTYSIDRLTKAINARDLTAFDNDGAELLAIKTATETALAACTTKEEILIALSAAIEEAYNVKTTAEKEAEAAAQALADAKEAALEEIGDYLDAASTEMFAVSGYSYTDGTETITLADYDALDQMLQDALEAVTTIDEITNTTTGIIVTFKNNIDLISDSSTEMIAYYKDYAKKSLLDLYPSTSYTTSATEYAQVKSEFEAALAADTVVSKSDIDGVVATYFESFKAVQMDSAAWIAKNGLHAYLLSEVADKLLIANELLDEDDDTYKSYRDALIDEEDKQFGEIDKCGDDETAIATVKAAAELAISNKISEIKAATEFIVTFVSSDVTISKQTVVINSNVSIPLLTEEQLTSEKTNGLTKTFEIIGYYTTFENDTYSNEYSFDTAVTATSAHTIYVKTQVVKYVFEPSSADDIANNGVFAFTDVADTSNSGSFSSGVRFDKTGDILKFSAQGGGKVKITPYVTQYSVKVNNGSAIANGVAYELFRDDTTEYSIERGEAHTVIMTKVVVEIEYGTPVTLTQKVSNSDSDDIKTTVLSGGTIELQNPTKTGYVFDGWYETYENDEYKDEITESSLTLSDSKTIYAKFTPITYNATFDSNGGTDVDAQNDITYGAKITEPTAPTNGTDLFLGWYTKDGTNDDWGDKYDFETILNSMPETGSVVNITLYGRWLPVSEATTVTVTYDLNGGLFDSSSTNPTSTAYKDFTKFEEPDATKLGKENKEFAGWFTKNGKDDGDWGNEFDFDTVVTDDAITISENACTLYAKWYDTIDAQQTSQIAYDFTTFTAQSTITENKNYGQYTVERIDYDFIEQTGYISLFIGNSIKFTVDTDGAVFMLSYSSNNSKRKVVLNSDNSSFDEVSKKCTNLTSGNTNYSFNGESISLEASAKGWLIFDNLKPGNYTVTFDTEEVDSNTNDSYSGVAGKGEQKIERIKLLDVKTVKKAVSAIDFDTTVGLDSITISNIKVTRLDNSSKVAVNNSDCTIIVEKDNVEIVNYADSLVPGIYSVTVKYGDVTRLTKNVEIEEPSVTINYGNNLTKKTTGFNEDIVYPTSSELEMENHQFARYYYDSEFTKPVDVSALTKVPAKSLTLYARYIELGVANVDYVSNATELVAILNSVGSSKHTVYITADIDMAGSDYVGLTGNNNSSFYGYGYTISNWNVADAAASTSFFGKLYNGTVKDITFDTCTITTDANYNSIFSSGIYADEVVENITFKDCSVSNKTAATTSSDSISYAALLAGAGNLGTQNNISTLTVKNITIIDSSVSSGQYSGGLFGYTNNGDIIVDGLYGNFTLNVVGKSNKNAGGVIGCIKNNTFSLSNSKITITINQEHDVTVGGKGVSIGGVVGVIDGSSATDNSEQLTVSDCDLTINMVNVGAYCGGIVGNDTSKSNSEITITNTAIDFNISCGSNAQCVAGIMGKIQSTSIFTLNNVEIEGSISSTSYTSNSKNYSSIIGNNGSSTTLSITDVTINELSIVVKKGCNANTVIGNGTVPATEVAKVKYVAANVSIKNDDNTDYSSTLQGTAIA